MDMEEIRYIQVEVCNLPDYEARINAQLKPLQDRLAKDRRYVLAVMLALASASACMLATDWRSLCFIFVLATAATVIGRRI
jgi:uncharacterized membrane protein YjjP (DUF1212 family)